MKGKKKEKKLVMKDGQTLDREKLISALKNYRPNVQVIFRENLFYRDTYFDDTEKSLLQEGGSLKIRVGSEGSRLARKLVIMRKKTNNPKKMKYVLWDEVELDISAVKSNSIQEMLVPLKPFFQEFDFSTIKSQPILTCETYRSLYSIIIDNNLITMYIDHINYEAGDRSASDEVVKFKMRNLEDSDIDKIFLYLLNNISEFYLINQSRYERAITKLA